MTLINLGKTLFLDPKALFQGVIKIIVKPKSAGSSTMRISKIDTVNKIITLSDKRGK